MSEDLQSETAREVGTRRTVNHPTYDLHDLADEKRHALEAWGGHVQRIVNPEDNVVPMRR